MVTDRPDFGLIQGLASRAPWILEYLPDDAVDNSWQSNLAHILRKAVPARAEEEPPRVVSSEESRVYQGDWMRLREDWTCQIEAMLVDEPFLDRCDVAEHSRHYTSRGGSGMLPPLRANARSTSSSQNMQSMPKQGCLGMRGRTFLSILVSVLVGRIMFRMITSM